MVSSTRVNGPAFHNRLSSATPALGKILAIDYGRRRIGLAISDEMGMTARPLATMQRKNRREDMKRLRDLAKTNGVQAILVGSPVHLNGQSSEMSEEVAQFASRIQKELAVPVELRDERLTSWEAQQMAAELGMGKNADIDSLAAAILLREYLDEARSSKKPKPSVQARCES